MSQKTKQQIQSEASTFIENNINRAITAADVRQRVIDLADSTVFTTGSSLVTGSITVSGSIIITGSLIITGSSTLISNTPAEFTDDIRHLKNYNPGGTASYNVFAGGDIAFAQGDFVDA